MTETRQKILEEAMRTIRRHFRGLRDAVDLLEEVVKEIDSTKTAESDKK